MCASLRHHTIRYNYRTCRDYPKSRRVLSFCGGMALQRVKSHPKPNGSSGHAHMVCKKKLTNVNNVGILGMDQTPLLHVLILITASYPPPPAAVSYWHAMCIRHYYPIIVTGRFFKTPTKTHRWWSCL